MEREAILGRGDYRRKNEDKRANEHLRNRAKDTV